MNGFESDGRKKYIPKRPKCYDSSDSDSDSDIWTRSKPSVSKSVEVVSKVVNIPRAQRGLNRFKPIQVVKPDATPIISKREMSSVTSTPTLTPKSTPEINRKPKLMVNAPLLGARKRPDFKQIIQPEVRVEKNVADSLRGRLEEVMKPIKVEKSIDISSEVQFESPKIFKRIEVRQSVELPKSPPAEPKLVKKIEKSIDLPTRSLPKEIIPPKPIKKPTPKPVEKPEPIKVETPIEEPIKPVEDEPSGPMLPGNPLGRDNILLESRDRLRKCILI